jgi:hypothetical protein
MRAEKQHARREDDTTPDLAVALLSLLLSRFYRPTHIAFLFGLGLISLF